MKIESGKVYNHEAYGEVRVRKIKETISSIDSTEVGECVEYKHIIEVQTVLDERFVQGHEIIDIEYNEFVDSIVQ